MARSLQWRLHLAFALTIIFLFLFQLSGFRTVALAAPASAPALTLMSSPSPLALAPSPVSSLLDDNLNHRPGLLFRTGVSRPGIGIRWRDVALAQLAFVFLFSILSIWGYRTRTRPGEKPLRFPLLSSFFRLALATAISAFGLWFWAYGVPGTYRSAGPLCRLYLFVLQSRGG